MASGSSARSRTTIATSRPAPRSSNSHPRGRAGASRTRLTPPAPPQADARPLSGIMYVVLRERLLGRQPSGRAGAWGGGGRPRVQVEPHSGGRRSAEAERRRADQEDSDGRGYPGGGRRSPNELCAEELAELRACGLARDGVGQPEDASTTRRASTRWSSMRSQPCCRTAGSLSTRARSPSTSSVSRTVAHEALTRLERTGLVEKDVNQRWYAGPLTVDRLRRAFRDALAARARRAGAGHGEPVAGRAPREARAGGEGAAPSQRARAGSSGWRSTCTGRWCSPAGQSAAARRHRAATRCRCSRRTRRSP